MEKSLFGDNCLTLINLANLDCLLKNKEQEVTALLSSSELQLFAGYSYAKRRLEWLGGRIAAKDALARLLGDASSAACRDLSSCRQSWSAVVSSPFAQWRATPVRFPLPKLSWPWPAKEQCGVDIEFCSERY
jgi:hypothetical protein